MICDESTASITLAFFLASLVTGGSASGFTSQRNAANSSYSLVVLVTSGLDERLTSLDFLPPESSV